MTSSSAATSAAASARVGPPPEELGSDHVDALVGAAPTGWWPRATRTTTIVEFAVRVGVEQAQALLDLTARAPPAARRAGPRGCRGRLAFPFRRHGHKQNNPGEAAGVRVRGSLFVDAGVDRGRSMRAWSCLLGEVDLWAAPSLEQAKAAHGDGHLVQVADRRSHPVALRRPLVAALLGEGAAMPAHEFVRLSPLRRARASTSSLVRPGAPPPVRKRGRPTTRPRTKRRPTYSMLSNVMRTETVYRLPLRSRSSRRTVG